MSKIVVDDSKYQESVRGRAKAVEVLGFLCGRLNEKKESSSREFVLERGNLKEELFLVEEEVEYVVDTDYFLMGRAIGVMIMAVSTLVIVIGVFFPHSNLIYYGLMGGVVGFVLKLVCSILDEPAKTVTSEKKRKRVAYMWWGYSDEIEAYSPKTARFIEKALSKSKWKDEEFKIIVGVN